MNKTTLNSQKDKHSMLSLRRATIAGYCQYAGTAISIHALRKESDASPNVCTIFCRYFYPRSPQGERPSTVRQTPLTNISIHALRKESDVIKQAQK